MLYIRDTYCTPTSSQTVNNDLHELGHMTTHPIHVLVWRARPSSFSLREYHSHHMSGHNNNHVTEI